MKWLKWLWLNWLWLKLLKWLKKKTQEREREFIAMHVDKNEALQRKLHEERLLAQRLMVFLLFNSILFLGFATLLIGAGKLLIVVPAIGFVGCLVLIPHSLKVKIELDALDKLLREPERRFWGQVLRGANMGLWLALFFLIIWGFSLSEVLC